MHQTSKKWEMPENNSSTRIIVQKGKLNWAGTCFWNIYKRMQVGTLVLWHLLKWSYQFSTAVCVDPGSCSGQWISLFGYSCSHKSQLPPLFELQFWSFVVLPGDVRFYTNSCTAFWWDRENASLDTRSKTSLMQCWLFSVLLVLQAKSLYIWCAISGMTSS